MILYSTRANSENYETRIEALLLAMQQAASMGLLDTGWRAASDSAGRLLLVGPPQPSVQRRLTTAVVVHSKDPLPLPAKAHIALIAALAKVQRCFYGYPTPEQLAWAEATFKAATDPAEKAVAGLLLATLLQKANRPDTKCAPAY